MPKSTGRARKEAPRRERPPRNPPAPLRWLTPIRALWAAIVVVLTLGGGLASALAVLPRVTVEADGAFDQDSNSQGTFEIRNTGPVPLVDGVALIGLCEIWPEGRTQKHHCLGPLKTRIGLTGWSFKRLGPDEHLTVTLEDFLHYKPPAHVGGADISIIVEYRPWIWPWKRTAEIRFTTKKMNDGQMRWFARPTEE